MPGQKNTGNKGRKRESGIATRHKNFVTNLIDDFRTTGTVEDVYVGRVTKKLGNGRVEVLYVAMETENTFDNEGNEIQKETPRVYEKQAVIKGSFRGKGKHSVWVEVGGIVAVADTGLGILEIMAVLTQDQLNTIAKTSFVDSRILNPVSTAGADGSNDAIEFTNDVDEKDSEVNIDNI